MTGLLSPESMSLAQRINALPRGLRREILESITPLEAALLVHAWRFWARPRQCTPPGDWATWVILAGRGFGKTRAGAEWVRENVLAARPDRTLRIALVGRTKEEVPKVMIDGPSGIRSISPPDFKPEWTVSDGTLRWPHDRAIAYAYGAEVPEAFRGPAFDCVWLDEFGAYGANAKAVWDNVSFGLRQGKDPRAVITTTGRPLGELVKIIADPETVTTRGSTFDNLDLPAKFFRRLIRRYLGTRLGQQELNGDILGAVDGALWQAEWLERNRRKEAAKDLLRVVVAVDPATSAKKRSDETGIIVCARSYDCHGYVLADRSGKYPPEKWAAVVAAAFVHFKADAIVGEINRGGDLVESNIRAYGLPNFKYEPVVATRGKATRAEPIATMTERDRMHLVGIFEELEVELTTWVPAMALSPGRLDALVWGMTALFPELEDVDPETFAAEVARMGSGIIVDGDNRSAEDLLRLFDMGLDSGRRSFE